MKKSKSTLSVAFALSVSLLAVGVACQKAVVGDQEAIRQSVERHLAANSSLNRAAMDTSFQQIQVNGETAKATVLFRLKNGGATMQMDYNLERHAGDWVVLKSEPAGGQFSHPPMDQVHSTMPADPAHPAIPNIHDLLPPQSSSSASNPPSSQSSNSSKKP